MKYGKAIGKKITAISGDDFTTLMHGMAETAAENGLTMAYEPVNRDYYIHDADGHEHLFTFKPNSFKTDKFAKHGNVRPSTIGILNPDTPKIRVYVTNNLSVIEHTDTEVKQYHMFVHTSNLFERAYRRRTWQTFSGYKSFEYDTDISEIVKTAKESVKYIADAFNEIFK